MAKQIEVSRHLVGLPEDVTKILLLHRASGALLRYSAPAYFDDGRVTVEIVVLETRVNPVLRLIVAAARRVWPPRKHLASWYAQPRTWTLLSTLAGLAGLAYTAWLAYLWLAAHLPIVIAGTVLAIIAISSIANLGQKTGEHLNP